LSALLAGVIDTRNTLRRPIPIFLKIAPDLSAAELHDIAEVARETGVDAVIATNTTLSRDGLRSAHKDQAGGLSGAPLFEKSTRILAQLSLLTNGEIPLIGVGGISNAKQAYAKIRAGASALQLYTGLVYGGLSLGAQIANDLDLLLKNDGYENISQAVGSHKSPWL
jgi:dihydroorotate dehydrogenase